MTDWVWEVKDRKEFKIVSGLSISVGILEWNQRKMCVCVRERERRGGGRAKSSGKGLDWKKKKKTTKK